MGVATAMKLIRIHHLTLAVRDAEAARATFESLFGVAGFGIGAIPAFGVRTAGVPIGEDLLQLASPMSMDNPVMRFLERKGEGFYNVALEVDDLDGAIRELSAKGIRVSEPVEAEQGLRSTFVTMAATHGLSVQLVEVISRDSVEPSWPPEPEPLPEPPPPATIAPTLEPASTVIEPLDLTPDEWSDVE
jgi:methylmalonyl-CoA/ethylmalonyl-CoA epimerase